MDAKPDKRAVVPSSLEDCQAMADYTDVMNAYMPSLGEIASDDFYVTYSTWNTLTSASEKNAYIWAREIFDGGVSLDWNNRYQQIFYANNILEVLESMVEITDIDRYNSLKGTALFFRAFAHYQLAQIFSKPYVYQTDNSGSSIPLRLTSDLNIPSGQSTVGEVYGQIVSDLEHAAELLPDKTHLKTRPNRMAVFALLARIFLTMQDYQNAAKNAELAIQGQGDSLIDYKDLSAASTYPIPMYNSEVIFHSTLAGTRILANTRHIVDPSLFESYLADDVRKTVFFKKDAQGQNQFRGSYAGSATYFNGLALDEMFLIYAECKVRLEKIEDGLNALNTLLETRFYEGAFVPFTNLDKQRALNTVLAERRKELLFRGLRWTDLRRLNLDPSTARTLKRELDGEVYEMEPNSPNYVYPFPDNVMQLTDFTQNERF
ncbi:RagB/SusD family nutrient uptake outer membrane protein [Sphingobacterium micropteri]|nr:RagB/SusD family nutrient uptake outer membrane protein [Sphingobacterium micropteri]